MKSETPKVKFQIPANYASLKGRERLAVWTYALCEHLATVGGPARGSDCIAVLTNTLPLDAGDKEPVKSGDAPSWEIRLRFATTDLMRAGYMTKVGGWWEITEPGKQALAKYRTPGEFFDSAYRASQAWKKANAVVVDPSVEQPVASVQAVTQPNDVSPTTPAASTAVAQIAFETAQESATLAIQARIDDMGPYDFQNLVAELLRGMGYVVREIAPPGADGGIDIVAYVDGFGVQGPRLRVQVKHRDAKATTKELRELHGLLRDGDVGLFVSSGGFTSEAIREARQTAKHIDLMDLPRLIELWQEHYPKLREQGRNMLRLTPVYFLTPDVL